MPSVGPIARAAAKWQIPEGLLSLPKSYTCLYTDAAIQIDGKLSEPVWQQVPFSDKFGDIVGCTTTKGLRRDEPETILPTRVKMCWDDQHLYIGATLTEPNLIGYLQQRDTIVFHDNDFEVFIDPGNTTRNYFEFEINTLNTLLDLFMPKPYSSGGHAVITWDAKGIEHQVALQGTRNQGGEEGKDTSWTVEIKIPFAALGLWGSGTTSGPSEGQFWRINFSRVQWDYQYKEGIYHKKRNLNGQLLPEHNWTWSPQGVINMHLPERWGYLFFAKNSDFTARLPVIERRKQLMWQLYYLQKAFFKKSKTYALTLGALGVKQSTVHQNIDGQIVDAVLKIEATPRQFIITLTDKQHKYVCSIDQLGNLSVRTHR